MLKLLWKSLLVSPAVLGAMLVVSTGAVRAATDASSLAAESSVATDATQLQTTEVPSKAIAATASPLPIAAVPTVPVAQFVPEFSSTTTQATVPETGAAPATLAQATTPEPETTEVLEQIDRYGREGNSDSLDQLNSVEQLSDVSPGDWAYEALRDLVERYGCIVGYPDGTYRGNRATTRYEFAAGLNACLNQIERLIAQSTADFVTREDLATLQRLTQEFEAELATLGTRVDNLEGRTAFLEDNQFSTTTKLTGEAIFAVTDEFAQDQDTNTVFGDRVRLELNTSFTGRDRLVTRLQAGNLAAFDTGSGAVDVGGTDLGVPSSAEGTQTFNVGENGNDFDLDKLAYFFPFGSSQVYVAATGGDHSDYAPTLSPFFEDGDDGGDGALSTFASKSPIYRIGGGAGAALSLGTGPLESILGPSTLSLGYLAGPGAENPGEDNGVFNGDYSALAQLNFNIGDRIGIGATYVHGYHNAGSPIFDGGEGVAEVGSFFANNPSTTAFIASSGGLPETPTVTNSYGIQAAFRLSDNISISGYGAYTDAILVGQGGAEIWTYGAGVAFSDLGKEGNVLGIFAGAQPYAGTIDTTLGNIRGGDRPYHVEAFYKYQLNDNISVTPGVIWLTAPNQGGEDAVIGTLRTTFSF